MSYKAPIEIIYPSYDKMKVDFENNVCRMVQSYGINVDKDELLKALRYDREQYNIGYTEGYNAAAVRAIKEFVERFTEDLCNIPRVDLGGHVYYLVGKDALYNLVKEMVGVTIDSNSCNIVD